MREEEFIERVHETALRLLRRKGIFEEIISEIGGGKQIRPRTIFNLTVALSLEDKERYIPLATSTEIVHLASLLHDDVIDNGSIRRGHPTLNARYGNLISILAGDYFYSSASHLVLENYDIEVSKIYSHSVSYMTLMELRQASSRWRTDISEDEYFDIIRGKTGALFSASFESVAFIADLAQSSRLHMREAGMLFGEIFQIIDDLLDFIGTGTGKSRLKDLSEGEITLPAIIFMHHNNEFSRMVREYFLSRGREKEILCDIERLLDYNSDFARIMNEIISRKKESLLSHLKEIEGFDTGLFTPNLERIIDRKR